MEDFTFLLQTDPVDARLLLSLPSQYVLDVLFMKSGAQKTTGTLRQIVLNLGTSCVCFCLSLIFDSPSTLSERLSTTMIAPLLRKPAIQDYFIPTCFEDWKMIIRGLEKLCRMHKCIKMDDTLFLKSPNSSELSLLSGLR